MEGKQYALKSIDKQFESLSKLRRTVENLPDDFPGTIFVHADPDYISTHISFDVNELRATRRLLGSNWHCVSVYTQNSGDRYFTYHNSENTELTVIQTKLGETCQRIQVGEKTIPIYKVVCSAQ